MSNESKNKKVIDILQSNVGPIDGVQYNSDGDVVSLNLSDHDLSECPSEIFYLTKLEELFLGNYKSSNENYSESGKTNHLTYLPPEIGRLTNLRKLHLDNNHLTYIPPEIIQLTNLEELALSNNPLLQLPLEIGQLANQRKLFLCDIGLTHLPPEIGRLSNLLELKLGRDDGPQFKDYRTNHLTYLPPEIGQLTNLRKLRLDYNHLTYLPSTFSHLTNLEKLVLSYNPFNQFPPELIRLNNLRELFLTDIGMRHLPPEICLLTNLDYLVLHDNSITYLPPEIGQLTNLKGLFILGTRITSLPSEIGRLINLRELYLPYNHLEILPAEICQLINLKRLNLHNNNLTQIPPEISKLTQLENLSLNDNPNLLTPPQEIVEQGTENILSFLQELEKNSIIRYEAKLIIVGEGGTGKTSLMRSLRDEAFEPNLPSTHGVEVKSLSLPHPYKPKHQITLNIWDFGGQHIYHATHQFFLTRRSLYIIVWNARLEAEQGRLDFWLETIKTLAPDAPILLVATHSDERTPDLNYQRYKEAYTQLVGNFSVSNKESTGFNELKTNLARYAANLRLMGQPWPKSWLEVEEALLALPEHHINASIYINCCTNKCIDANVAIGTLGNYLHDLGKILFFRDDPVLSNLVVLKPNWVTKAISRVLTDEETKKAKGILSHSALPIIWSNDDDGHSYEPHLYPIFLRLMERFDLSYQIDSLIPGNPSTRSLVPQLLPHEPPAILPGWPDTSIVNQTHIEMRYRFAFTPAGIMSWFIVRTHIYTQNMHWREGVVLKYQDQMARVELNPTLRELRLVVWGVQPHNFFTILMNTLDLILDRFEGLHVQREVPCICHWHHETHVICPRFYRYEDLVRRIYADKLEVECPESYSYVSVPELLYGIHTSTNEQVIADIRRGQKQLLQEQQQIHQDLLILPEIAHLLKEVNQRSELIWRSQLKQWNLQMQLLETECPNTFFLTLSDMQHFNPKNWIS